MEARTAIETAPKLAQAHCCAVARTLADLGVDAPGVAAGLLCDVLESTMMTEAQLRKLMPGSMVDIVANVSKLSGVCQVHLSNLLRGACCGALLARLSCVMPPLTSRRPVLVETHPVADHTGRC